MMLILARKLSLVSFAVTVLLDVDSALVGAIGINGHRTASFVFYNFTSTIRYIIDY